MCSELGERGVFGCPDICLITCSDLVCNDSDGGHRARSEDFYINVINKYSNTKVFNATI